MLVGESLSPYHSHNRITLFFKMISTLFFIYLKQIQDDMQEKFGL